MAKNKEHKQRFQSKHERSEDKGRKTDKEKSVKSFKLDPSDVRKRMNQAAEARRKKKSQTAVKLKRFGSSWGIPRIVGIVPANESGNTSQVLQGLSEVLDGECTDSGPSTIFSSAKKCSFTFICEKNCNDQDCVDVGKVADILILVLDTSQFIHDVIKEVNTSEVLEDENKSVATTWYSDAGLCTTDYTRGLISNINSQGAPTVVVILQNTQTFDDRQRQKLIKLHERYFLSMLHDTTKVFATFSERDFESVLRHIQVVKLRPLHWREQRPYLAVEGVDYDSATKEMTICGILRGQNLSANQLVHLTNHGTFQISTIYSIDGSGEKKVLGSSHESERESLLHVQANSTLETDDFPIEEEYHKNEVDQRRRIRVPIGTSEDQAAWYDTEENLVNNDSEDMDKSNEEDIQNHEEMMTYRSTQTDVDFLKADDIIRHEKMTEEERLEELENLRLASEEEAWNPDMVDTPINLPARQRFSKYRGLKSFHTGKWDPSENLPPQYGYIYKLQGYSQIRKAAIKAREDGSAMVGQQIYITLVNVPESVYYNQGDCVLIASGQLEHEQKWSVLHFQLQKTSETGPIKSKTPMLAHIGFRKYYVSPLFSELSSGDRTKFSRFFPEFEQFRMGTFYGPITYTPTPILLFQVSSLEEQAEGNPLKLCCFGGALPPNPDFILLKKVTLSGRVAVIHKKQIVVKYMFFNEDDIKWFQPVDLYTTLGRRGKIAKPVGTHGLFKAALNDQVMQHDVVCMDLYKRVFPKWTTVAFNCSEVVELKEEEY